MNCDKNVGFRLYVTEKVFCVVLRDDPSTVNISDEMTKTSFGNIWKNLNTDNSKNDKSAKRFASVV